MGVVDRELFIELDSSEAGLQNTAKEACGVEGIAGLSRIPKEAPRVFTFMLGSLEVVVKDTEIPTYFKVSAHGGCCSQAGVRFGSSDQHSPTSSRWQNS